MGTFLSSRVVQPTKGKKAVLWICTTGCLPQAKPFVNEEGVPLNVPRVYQVCSSLLQPLCQISPIYPVKQVLGTKEKNFQGEDPIPGVIWHLPSGCLNGTISRLYPFAADHPSSVVTMTVTHNFLEWWYLRLWKAGHPCRCPHCSSLVPYLKR